VERNFVRNKLSMASMLAVVIVASACDPRQAVGPDAQDKAPPAAVVGQVYSSTTGAALAGAHVEVIGIGSGFTDRDGMYRLGSPAAVQGLSALALRVEAPGHAPVTRLIYREGDVIQIPRVHLTTLHQGTQLGPEGGEYALSNGVRIQAPAGAVGRTVGVGVTLLAPGTSGSVDGPSTVGLNGSFHVSPAGTDFKRPLRLSIPLQESARPLSQVSLYTFDTAARRWVFRGTGTVDATGLSAVVPVDEGETYVYTIEKNWNSRQTADPVVTIVDGELFETGCIPDGGTFEIPEFSYNTLFSTTADAVRFPGLVAYLYSTYGGDRTVPATEFAVDGGDRILSIQPRWITEEREGEAWLLAEPAVKYPYEWHNKEWDDWILVGVEECEADPDDEDPQGIIA
jgi:hypothetical protein